MNPLKMNEVENHLYQTHQEATSFTIILCCNGFEYRMVEYIQKLTPSACNTSAKNDAYAQG
jgi:hypothetical protein